MRIPALKIRWINYAGYEILLPGGKTLLLDPCRKLDERDDPESFYSHGADYILLSHVHYDHTKDLKTLLRYCPRVIVGAMSAKEIAVSFAVNLDELYPVYPGEEYRFPDFTLRVYRGKHKFRKGCHVFGDEKDFLGFPPEHRQESYFGSMEYLDFSITTSENICIFVSGGGITDDTFCNLPAVLERERPNILLKQTTSRITPEEFAVLIQGYHAQLVFPMHQDGLAAASGMSLEEYFGRVNRELTIRGCQAYMVNPVPHRWYQIATEIVSWREEE